MDIGRVAFIDVAAVAQPEQGLDLPDDLPAGGFGFEHLPEEALESEPQAEDAVAAVGAFVLGREQGRREEVAQVFLELGQSGLANALSGPVAQGGQPGTEGREIGCVHKAVYIPPLLTHLLCSVFMNVNLAQIEDEYTRLRTRLGRLGWISHGYVQDRGPGAGGPCYQWTRKVKAKTVSVALSREQYEALKEAIDNWHHAQEILQRMQALSRQVIFDTLPSPPRRKRLGKKVLGLI